MGEIRPLNQIRAANLPPYCSACFGQNSRLRHIDFDAECDRGYGESVEQPFDDLILCESCVRVGAEIIGMIAEEQWKEREKDLEAKLDFAERKAKQQQKYADSLEQALVEDRETPVEIDHRKKPRKVEAV